MTSAALTLFFLTRFVWQLLSCQHRLQFARSHRQDGCHELLRTRRAAFKALKEQGLPALFSRVGWK